MPSFRSSGRLTGSLGPLTAEDFAGYLPADPGDTITRWPYANIPLTQRGEFRESITATDTDSQLVRGRITRPFPGSAESELTVRVGGIASSKLLYLRSPISAPFWQLVGMGIEAACMLQPAESELDISREGSLDTVYGIETPLRPGDASGIARGRVLAVQGSDHNYETWAMDLDIGEDVLAVNWNPSVSLPLSGIVRENNLIAMELNHVGDDPIQYRYHSGIANSIEPV